MAHDKVILAPSVYYTRKHFLKNDFFVFNKLINPMIIIG